jgi:hypothetical protein
MKRPKPSAAAYDLGLTEESRQDYKRRVSLMFAEGCIILGRVNARKLFRAVSAANTLDKSPPPRKRKGSHDPVADRLLLQLWKTGSNGMTKHAFAEMALKNHAVRTGKKVQQHSIAVRSMVRRLDRLLEREAKVRQLGSPS